MVGWHNAVATRLGVALAKTEGREPEDGKAMLHIEAWAFPSPHFVLRRDKMPPLLTSGFPYLYVSTPGRKPWGWRRKTMRTPPDGGVA